jgi:genome maintenance exonuclease 1
MTFIHQPLQITPIEAITSDDGSRVYVTPKGDRYPSVTTVLGTVEKPELIEWRNRVGDHAADKKTRTSARRGKALHTMVEDYLNNTNSTIPDATMPLNTMLFKSIRGILDRNVEIVRAQEATLYSDFLETAGQVDLAARWDGTDSIVDFKTKEKPQKIQWMDQYFIQTSAYAVMIEELTGRPIPQLVILVAVEDGDPQIFITKRDKYISKFIEIRKKYNA